MGNVVQGPAGKAESRDWVRSKVFEREGMGFGEGEGKLSSESFPSPSPIFFPALSYDQEVLHAREDDLRGDGGEKQAGELGKHRKAGLAEDALHMVRHEQHERDERHSLA